jgi:hypothetical protein
MVTITVVPESFILRDFYQGNPRKKKLMFFLIYVKKKKATTKTYSLFVVIMQSKLIKMTVYHTMYDEMMMSLPFF